MLSDSDRRWVWQWARAAVAAAVAGRSAPEVDPAAVPAALRQPAAAFITLRRAGELRGCIGGLEARWPLYLDVGQHAAQAATQDYRFEPVAANELDELEIEISLLTEPRPLAYTTPAELLERLRPGVDGVTLAYAQHRATFLPQVWERVPEPARFLELLCEKMGLPADVWRRAHCEVSTYQVEVIEETAGRLGPRPD